MLVTKRNRLLLKTVTRHSFTRKASSVFFLMVKRSRWQLLLGLVKSCKTLKCSLKHSLDCIKLKMKTFSKDWHGSNKATELWNEYRYTFISYSTRYLRRVNADFADKEFLEWLNVNTLVMYFRPNLTLFCVQQCLPVTKILKSAKTSVRNIYFWKYVFGLCRLPLSEQNLQVCRPALVLLILTQVNLNPIFAIYVQKIVFA